MEFFQLHIMQFENIVQFIVLMGSDIREFYSSCEILLGRG